MKKIFTLFIATLVATSMFALPLNIKSENSNVKQPTALSVEKKEKAEKLHNALSSGKMERVAAVPKLDATKRLPSAKGDLLTVKKAQENVVEYNYDAIAGGPIYYEDGTWWVGLGCDDVTKPEYGVLIYLNFVGKPETYCGTYTTKDFETSFTYMMTTTSYGSIFFDKIEMTIVSDTISEHLEKITLDATLWGDDGITYKVHAEHEKIVPKENVTALIMDAVITQETDGFTFAGKNSNLDINLYVKNADDIVGTYAKHFIDWEKSMITYKNYQVEPINFKLIIQIGQMVDGSLVYAGTINMLGNDTIQYNINIAAPMPDPTDTIDVTCHNLKLDDSMVMYFNEISFEASNDDYDLLGAWIASEIIPGVYTNKESVIYVTDKATDAQYRSLASKIILSIDKEGNWVIEATAWCSNNKVYRLHLDWYIAETTDTILVSFDKSALALFYPEYKNDLMLYNRDDRYNVSLDVMGVPLGGSFTDQNMDMYYTKLEVKQDTVYVPVEVATIENGLLTQVGDSTKMQVDFLTFDGLVYHIELYFVAATPTKTVKLNYDNAEFINNFDYNETYTLIGYSEDSLNVMVVTVNATCQEEVAGNFVNDGLFGKFGEGQLDMVYTETYYGEWNAAAYRYDLYYVQKGNIAVKMDKENNISLTGSLICDNAVQYELTMASKYEEAHLDFDATSGSVDRIYTAADKVRFEDLTAEYGAIYFDVQSAEHLDVVAMYFFAEATDADIVIPVGTYEINDSWDYNTVLASSGVTADGSLNPSLYCQLDSKGGILEPIYFMVGGTVEVSKNQDGSLYIEINAVNSYNVPIHIVYNASTSSVVDVNSDNIIGVRKIMKDDQLYILRNGEMYSVTGNRVK